MKQKQSTIQARLSLSFMVILFIVLVAFGSFYTITESKRIQDQAFETLKQNVVSISSSLDQNVSQMDMVSANVLYSNLIRERFANYASLSQSLSSHDDVDIQDEMSYVDNIKVLGDLLTAIIGPQWPVDQINLYSLNNGVFGTGLETGTRDEHAASQIWFLDVMRVHGSKVITLQKEDLHLSRYSTDPNGKSFLSLTRIYFDSFNNPEGIVEVKKSYNKIAAQADRYSPLYGEQVLIFDGEGKLMFPMEQIGETTPTYFNAMAGISGPSIYEIDNESGEPNDYIIGVKSAYTGFTTAIVVSRAQLFASVYDNIKSFLVVLVGIVLFAFLLVFYTAHQITKPIHQIYTEIRSMDFESDNYNLSPNIKTKITEFTTLYDALLNMQNKLQTSVSNQLLLKNKEMQSKMLALQSQMNPHFLFNSLSTIQSMSDEKMNDEITLMCQTTSSILRYISSDKDQTVPIQLELMHAVEYLKCMQIRYENQLFYEIKIPKKMEDIHIPKLCIQLLVENSIKFMSEERPPWHITISGEIIKSTWQLSVVDNGPGFSDEALLRIQEEVDNINATGLLPSLELKGMGLLNIYMRLKLLYPKEVYFKVHNVKSRGAVVTIGGEL